MSFAFIAAECLLVDLAGLRAHDRHLALDAIHLRAQHFALPRRMWDPATLAEHALDWTVYETFARVASSAASAPA